MAERRAGTVGLSRVPRRLVQRQAQQTGRWLWAFDEVWRRHYTPCVAGVDEAGRGPWAGPVVAAAVILPSSVPPALLGLRDSKQLTPTARTHLAGVIRREALSLGVGMVQADSIDQINILQATFQAMRTAVAQLTPCPDLVLVDGWPIPGLHTAEVGIVQGDTLSASIAAASILAKVTRDRLMEAWDNRFPGYGFRHHKGYGTVRHRTALARYGPSPIHRVSFAPIRHWLLAHSSKEEEPLWSRNERR